LPSTVRREFSTRRTREATFLRRVGGAVSNQKQTCDHNLDALVA